MVIRIDIPHDQEQALREALGSDLDRAALEAMAIEGYRSGKLSAADVGRLLGFKDRWAVNGWLASRRVTLNYDARDFDADRETLDRLFGKSA